MIIFVKNMLNIHILHMIPGVTGASVVYRWNAFRIVHRWVFISVSPINTENSICNGINVIYSICNDNNVIYSICNSIDVIYSICNGINVIYSICNGINVIYSICNSINVIYIYTLTNG